MAVYDSGNGGIYSTQYGDNYESGIIQEAKDFLRFCSDNDSNNRVEALDDLKFAGGDQWPVEIQNSRLLESRPYLTINKIDAYCRQIANQQRQQRPRMVAHGMNTESDEKIAEIVTGILRHIENQSDADAAYDNAFDFAHLVLITTAVTSAVWLIVTFLTKPEPDEILVPFYRKVRPSARMWGPIAAKVKDVVPQKDGILNLSNWAFGCLMIYMTLFGFGKIIFGETLLGVGFLAIAAISFSFIYRSLSKRGWESLGG